jgi:hypothetical protein
VPKERIVIVEEATGSGCAGRLAAVAGIFLSVVWLLNFSAGILEIPDNAPFVGNLDEAAATAILIGCLRYLGIDVLPFGRRAAGRTNVIDVKATEDKQP